MAKGDLWVAVQPGSIGVGADDYVMLNVGDVAEDGHPVMAGRDAMFQRLPIRFRLGDGQAEAQAVEPAPVAEPKSKAQRGPQTAQEPSGTSGQPEGKGETGKPGSGSGTASVGLTSDDAPGARRSK